MNTRRFTPKLLPLSICLGMAASAQPLLAQQQDDIEEVIVLGSFRESLATALVAKRNNAAAIDSIVADDIASFPDNNLAESLQRIPGINIDRVGGEGKQISVRGLSADFTRVRINGMETISTGVNNRGRAFDFNIFASELFNRIDVRKSQSAAVEEGSLGATVDLSTGRPLDYESFTLVTSVQGGYNDQAESFDPRFTGLVSVTNEPGTFGALFSLAYSEREVYQYGHNSGRWEANNSNPANVNNWANSADLPTEVNQAVHPRFPRQLDRTINLDRLGMTGALQWQPNDDTSLSLDLMYADMNQVQSEFTLTPISLARTGATGRKETTVNDYFYDAERNGLLYADLSGVDVRNENYRQDWTTQFHQVSLSLDHSFSDNLRLKALAGTSESDHKVHSEMTAIFERYNADMSYDYRNSMTNPLVAYGFDTTSPDNYWVAELRDRPADTTNTFDTVRGQVEYDFAVGAVDMTLNTGVSWKEFSFDNNQYTRDRALINQNNHTSLAVSVPSGCGITLDDLQVTGDMGSVYTPSGGAPSYLLPNLDKVAAQYGLLTDSTCFPLVANEGADRSVTEESLGFHVQLDFSTELAGMPFRGDLGVRDVETDQTSNGLVSGARQEIKRSYSDTLPAINLVLEPVENVLVRAAWSEVMSRPGLGNLTPGGSVDRFNRVLTAGNPYLDPFRAKATDLSVEWYFAEEALLSLAYFDKDIESFPVSIRKDLAWSEIRALGYSDSLLEPGPATVNDIFNYRTSVNGDGGFLEGWELQYQQPITVGPAWLQNFGIKANYTYIESELDSRDSNGNRIVTRMNGQSKISWNTTLWYENKAGFSGRVSWTYRDAYQTANNTTAVSGVDTTASTKVVDAAFSYALNDNIKLTFDALNLTDETETWLLGDYNYLDTQVYSGRQFYVGAQYSF
ncbi:TonB-dependent receptor [Cellvibrio japonicus]|uniref:TonB-dependent receptor n=1 Tax=Cellvibrio japonicus (strain Ueda107) TaxID=498211 RepID=B3PH01_CELJU|nr:TonB-dependent receptor [Cellvibrio japonicus]ACE83434.1 TonB-dependent receptor [Cellvibrio japonicus Ueda107]QEI13801.1 TonB-dependent receptor [Cellvibrio japonicus]QEI17375.1 TonB-dependent receptor [Cellvibrio japonicus]QEI20951.1 TonB-dependent receptor [Cellvibrio japonicus]